MTNVIDFKQSNDDQDYLFFCYVDLDGNYELDLSLLGAKKDLGYLINRLKEMQKTLGEQWKEQQ